VAPKKTGVGKIRRRISETVQDKTLVTINRRLKACPHLLPKTAISYPETGDFVAVSEDFVLRNGEFVAVFGNKIACFRIQSCRFRQQVWTGLKM